MKYDIEKFIKITQKSRSTIYRFYKKNKDLFSETGKKGTKTMYPEEHVKYFDSEAMFDENFLLKQENQSMRNLIDCLIDRDSLQCRLWEMDWTFFSTIAYSRERNKKSCYKQMTGLFKHLNKMFGSDTDLRLFFTCEPFANRTGYHNHFVIYVENNKLREQVYNEINNYFEYDRVDIKNYDRYRAGLFYISKEGLHFEDWDYLDNKNQKPETDED
jgi:hypothetical protein